MPEDLYQCQLSIRPFLRGVILALLMFGAGFGPVVFAESPLFVIQESKQVYSTPRLKPEWDNTLPTPAKSRKSVDRAARSVGIVGLDMRLRPNRYPVVQAVFQGTPAHREGIRPGDVIVAVNGIQAVGKSLAEVDAMISDIPGDVVALTIARQREIRQITLTVMSLDEVETQTLPALSAFLELPSRQRGVLP